MRSTDVLIIGGGPAGALLAFLLARRGVQVLLVEKEHGFERNFRGDTIAARSVQTLRQLGFEPALKRHGYIEIPGISMWEDGSRLTHLDYRRFPIDALPIDIPQPALLSAIVEAASEFPNFEALMGANCTGLIEEGDAVCGATLRQKDGDDNIEVRARLVVGADGRFSRVRKAAKLDATVEPLQRDFLWFKLPRPEQWGDEGQLVVHRDRHLVILPTFPDFLRVGCNLPKGAFKEFRKAGLAAFKEGLAELDSRLAPLFEEHIRSWDDTSFLEIITAVVPKWSRDGLILIGDASHTCSPILGQGINLALQDSVFLAPIVIAALAKTGAGDPTPAGEFDDFVAKRRAHKMKVLRLQRMQEASLAQYKPFKTMMRRIRLRAMNMNPLKYRILHRMINGPQAVDTEAHDTVS